LGDAEFIVSLFALDHARPFVRMPKAKNIRKNSHEHEDYIVVDGVQRVGTVATLSQRADFGTKGRFATAAA